MTKRIVASFLFMSLILAGVTPIFQAQKAEAKSLQESLEKLQNALNEGAGAQAAKDTLLALITGIETFLKTLQTQVNSKALWTSEQRSKATEKINAGLTSTADFRAKAEAIDVKSSTAITDLKKIYNDGKSWWATYRVEVKVVWADILIENGQRTIDASKAIQEGISSVITTLESSGANTTELRSLLEQLNTTIAQAEGYIAKAVSIVEQMKTATPSQSLKLYVDARVEIKRANLLLLDEGREIIQKIMTEIKNLSKK